MSADIRMASNGSKDGGNLQASPRQKMRVTVGRSIHSGVCIPRPWAQQPSCHVPCAKEIATHATLSVRIRPDNNTRPPTPQPRGPLPLPHARSHQPQGEMGRSALLISRRLAVLYEDKKKYRARPGKGSRMKHYLMGLGRQVVL